MNFKKWVKSIQTAGYNGARTVLYLKIYCQNVVAKRESTIFLLSFSILTNLQPENFNIEMNIKINLGPLHFPDNFVKEILASDSSQSYLRKEQSKNRRLATNDKSAAMETIEKNIVLARYF